MSEFIVTAFLVLSLLAYVVSGGADFGVGILELFAPRLERAALRRAGERAIAPVWEANHIWIILALVILFVGFPSVHVHLTTYLHIPLLLMLIGIVLRGTAFTFRYYNVGENADDQRLWTWLFRTGSLVVPIIFGHLAAAMSRGRIPSEATTVFDSYLAPWLGFFPLMTGLFTASLFAWLAAVFLIGEANGDFRVSAIHRARLWTAILVPVGGAVTGAAWVENVPWLDQTMMQPLLFIVVVVATLAIIALWRMFDTRRYWTMRVLAGVTAAAILAGYWGAVYPTAIQLRNGDTITWHEAAAPKATNDALAITLLIAATLILPGLAWLYRLFKSNDSLLTAARENPDKK